MGGARRTRAQPFSAKEVLFVTKHPHLQLIDVRCSSCGRTFSVRSTAEAISVDTCSNCHPAYTGEERARVTGDRVERFNRRRALAAVAGGVLDRK
jgi:large subunit ribosomal protein L31